MEYSFCGGVALRVVCSPPDRKARVMRILQRLFSLVPISRARPDRGIEILINDQPDGGVPDSPSLSATKTAQGYHLRAGGSFFALDVRAGRAVGSLSSAFMDSPLEDQRGLFLFVLLLLLPARGRYGLHAAGVRHAGRGFLLVGNSGSGKTTLSYALVRSGWEYLSDDSVLLRRASSGLEALAFGRPFHCSPAMFRHFPELARGAPPPLRGKRLVDIAPLYPGRFCGTFKPHVILFPEIAGTRSSRLVPLSSTTTLLRLIAEGTGLLHNRDLMADQMAILRDLATSVRGFRLMPGADVHNDPAAISGLLQQIATEGGHVHEMYSAA